MTAPDATGRHQNAAPGPSRRRASRAGRRLRRTPLRDGGRPSRTRSRQPPSPAPQMAGHFRGGGRCGGGQRRHSRRPAERVHRRAGYGAATAAITWPSSGRCAPAPRRTRRPGRMRHSPRVERQGSGLGRRHGPTAANGTPRHMPVIDAQRASIRMPHDHGRIRSGETMSPHGERLRDRYPVRGPCFIRRVPPCPGRDAARSPERRRRPRRPRRR